MRGRGRGGGGRSRGGFRGAINMCARALTFPCTGGSRGFRGGR